MNARKGRISDQRREYTIKIFVIVSCKYKIWEFVSSVVFIIDQVKDGTESTGKHILITL